MQLVQDTPGKLIVRVVKTDQYKPEDEQKIRSQIHACVPSGLEVTFEYVDYLEPTERGKHVFFKQSLPLPSAFAG